MRAYLVGHRLPPMLIALTVQVASSNHSGMDGANVIIAGRRGASADGGARAWLRPLPFLLRGRGKAQVGRRPNRQWIVSTWIARVVMFARPTTQGGGEVTLDWLAGWSNERGPAGGRPGSDARAVSVADRHAVMPSARQRPLGDAQVLAEPAHRTGAVLLCEGPIAGAGWLHQEDAEDARCRNEPGA